MGTLINQKFGSSIYRSILGLKMFPSGFHFKLILILLTSICSLGVTKYQVSAAEPKVSKESETFKVATEFSKALIPAAEIGIAPQSVTNNQIVTLSSESKDTQKKVKLVETSATNKLVDTKGNSQPNQPVNRSTAKDLQLADDSGKDKPDVNTTPSTPDTSQPSTPTTPSSTTPTPTDTNQPTTPTTTAPDASQPKTPTAPASTAKVAPFVLDNIQIDSSYKLSNYKIYLFEFLPTVQYRLSNGNKISFRVGYNTLTSDRVTGFQPQDTTIIPIRFGWEGSYNHYRLNLQAAGTYYKSDGSPYSDSVGFDTSVNYAALSNLFVGFRVERAPMRYAPSTFIIPTKTTNTQFGPNLYWQIDRNTSLLSLFSVSNYNNDNRSQLSYTKIKRNIGQFSVAANLVTFSFDRSTPDAFFSPADYLIYNGEVGWQGNLTKALNLRLQFNLGEQRYNGAYTQALYYEAQLTNSFTPKIDGFLKYSYGNLQNNPVYNAGTGAFYREYYWVGQLRYKF